MTDKDVKNLSRTELLEILIEVSAENSQLKDEIDRLNAELESRQINIETSGSIAEAALNLTDIFAEAQKAADLYLENIQRQEEASQTHVLRLITDTKQKCLRMEEETQEKCDEMEFEARNRALRLEADTRDACGKLMQKTQDACRRMLQETERCRAELIGAEPEPVVEEPEPDPAPARRRFFGRREVI